MYISNNKQPRSHKWDLGCCEFAGQMIDLLFTKLIVIDETAAENDLSFGIGHVRDG